MADNRRSVKVFAILIAILKDIGSTVSKAKRSSVACIECATNKIIMNQMEKL